MRVFETRFDGKEYDTPEAAIEATEKHGSGSVVAFVVRPNLPGLLPEWVYESCNMWSFNLNGNGKWRGHYIFDGHGRDCCDDKPH